MKRLLVVLQVLLALPFVAFAGTLPDTGQTKCYDNTQEISCPSAGEDFYGQDANNAPCNPHSYTKLDENGNDLPESAMSWVMVRDNVTGLIWENKTDDGSVHDKDYYYDWYDAQSVFIATLNSQNFGGYSDWRLPTIKELFTLVDSSRYYEFINTDYFPNSIQTHWSCSWSSTTFAHSPNEAWSVRFSYGYLTGALKIDPRAFNVRAVRGGQWGSNNFTINPGGTIVTDTSTGLMWEVKTDDGGPRDKDNSYTWQQALSYCENLTLGGHSDWRLPNRNELQSIVDYNRYYPCIDAIFSNTVSSGYWSSTTHADGPGYTWDYAWPVDFDLGYYVGHNRKLHYNYVRAVRSGQCGSFVDSDGDSIPDVTEHNYTTSGDSGHIAEPVNTALGNYTYQHTDLKISGRGLPFDFQRGYNSLDPYNGPLGYGWTHSYNISVSEYESAAVVKWGDGHEDVYNNQSGSFVPALPGIYDTLVKNVDSTYTLTRKDQSQYQFNTSGKLTSFEDKNGNTIRLTYDGNGNLATITDTAGRNITLTYDAENRITLITDPIGRTVGYLYDANGDLIKVTDARSGETSYGYDTAHRITSIILPRGNTLLENIYDTEGRVISQTNGRGYTTTFAYDTPVANQTTITDHLNHTTIHIHDSMHRLLENVDPLGNSLQYTYDSNSNRTQVTDKKSNAISYTYDTMGNVASKTDPLSNVTSITYDSNNNPLTRTDALSNATAYAYDGIGNLTSITDALSHASTITYNSYGQPLTITDANGNTTTNTYDAQGNLIEIEDDLGNTTSFTYDGIGRRLTVTDANNHTSTFTYDANDNPLTITDPLTGVTTYTYDANNNRISVTDPKGNTTSYVYNTNDLLISTTDELSNVTAYAFDELDRKSSTTDARGNITSYTYDGAGNLIQVRDALNNITGYSYDANGNMISMTNAKGQVTSYTYDTLNRLTRITDPLGNAAENTYDALGRLTQVEDAKGNTTSYTYDALGRLTKVTDALAKETVYGYDNVGNRTSITDAKGNATTLSYNTVNRLIGKTDPLLNSYSYSYDPVGNRISLTDANGTTINYSYDDNNRLDTITYPNASTVSFTYDANGNRTQMADPNGPSTYQYDELNRMVSSTGAYGKTVGYSYDAVGNRISLTYPGSKVVNYAYDALNRISTVTDWLSGVTTYTYDATSNVSHIANPNNTTVDYSYDNANRLTALANKKSNTATISSYNFTLDNIGNHTKVLRITPLDPDFTPGTQNYSYDEDNRMMSVNVATYTFDDNGNMTGNSTGDLYAYDYEDRLLEASRGGITSHYTYDGVGNRIARIEDSITTRYVLDVNGALTSVLAETNGSGNIAAYYVYGLGLISRIKPDNSVQYYHYDNRGSTIALTNTTEIITDKYEYDEFGTIANAEGSTSNPFKFVGRFGVMDEGNGLCYIRARYYMPELGRFISKDPLTGTDGDNQSLNRYVYALNNPVRMIDISGFSAQEGGYYQNYDNSSDTIHNAQLHGRLTDAEIQAQMAKIAIGDPSAAYWGAYADALSTPIGIAKIVKGTANVAFSAVSMLLPTTTVVSAITSSIGIDAGFAEIASGIAELTGNQDIASKIDKVTSVVSTVTTFAGMPGLVRNPSDVVNQIKFGYAGAKKVISILGTGKLW